MEFTFKLRRDVAADWTTANPILLEGEPGIEIDTNKFKIGDGLNYWNDLDYFIDQDTIQAMIDLLVLDTGAVVSIFGRSGVVTAQTGDYNKTQVGLANVDNTSDLAKPISTATQAALNALAVAGGAITSVFGRTGAVVAVSGDYTKAQVGLGSVNNTADVDKPISTATQAALDDKAASAHVHGAADVTSGTFAIGRIPTGTSGSTVALGNHNHPVPPATVVLTDASTIVVDATLGERFRVVLTGDHILGNPTGAVDGQMLLFELIQDGTGGQAVTLGSKFNDPNAYFTGQSTVAGKRDKLGVQYNLADDQFDVLAFAPGF